MFTETIKDSYEKIKKSLHQYGYHYYVLDQPLVSDKEYDLLYRKLLEIEREYPEIVTADSPSRRVGAKPASQFAGVNHKYPLFSLDNALSDEELSDFDKKVKRALINPKLNMSLN